MHASTLSIQTCGTRLPPAPPPPPLNPTPPTQHFHTATLCPNSTHPSPHPSPQQFRNCETVWQYFLPQEPRDRMSVCPSVSRLHPVSVCLHVGRLGRACPWKALPPPPPPFPGGGSCPLFAALAAT